MRLLFVMNPSSGTNDPDGIIRSLQTSAAKAGIETRFLFTTGENDDVAIKDVVLSFSPDRIVAGGGDGTVQLVARNIIGLQIPMAILPLGSANGLATALGIPKRLEDAMQIIIEQKKTIPLDLLRLNDNHICIHLCDIGTNALLVKNYEEAGDKGMLGYARHLISSIRDSDLVQFEIRSDGKTHTKEGYMLVVANAHKYGTGVQISEGSVSDGMFEICNIQRIDLESAVKAGLTAINIFVDRKMFSDVIKAREAYIRISPAAHLQVDGEYIGEVTDLKVEIISSALNVIVPDEEQ